MNIPAEYRDGLMARRRSAAAERTVMHRVGRATLPKLVHARSAYLCMPSHTDWADG